MPLSPELFFKALADQTRLRLLTLLDMQQELCVCELTETLEISQPKASRHLAILREANILNDRREGQWIYYQINPSLPKWATDSLKASATGCKISDPFKSDIKRLAAIQDFTRLSCNG